MRAQRRRFVVEVKRGTSRASFVSTDAAAEKFSSAEDALFGAKAKPVAVAASAVPAPHTPPPVGRILRDLHEPPPPPLPELPPPARRGRKPGSKNKPKPVLAAPPATPPALRNARPAWADALAAKYATFDETLVPRSPAPSVAPAREMPQATATGDLTSQSRRTRLRDRSSILKRYVLGTEPAPGQPGWVRGLAARRRG